MWVPDEFSITESGVGSSGALGSLLKQRAGPYPTVSGWQVWVGPENLDFLTRSR